MSLPFSPRILNLKITYRLLWLLDKVAHKTSYKGKSPVLKFRSLE